MRKLSHLIGREIIDYCLWRNTGNDNALDYEVNHLSLTVYEDALDTQNTESLIGSLGGKYLSVGFCELGYFQVLTH